MSQKRVSGRSKAEKDHYFQGTSAPWYKPRELTESERNTFRQTSIESSSAKAQSQMVESGRLPNVPNLYPEELMPQLKRNGFRTLSLFSGCGGLDIGFDLAGYRHVASFEILEEAARIIRHNRPKWKVLSGDLGDVRKQNWLEFRGIVDVLHGGPPCQPFSSAGKQGGKDDSRNLIFEFARAVGAVSPKCFVMENVPALLQRQHSLVLDHDLYTPLSNDYTIFHSKLTASDFGVPQKRTRVFFVGVKKTLLKKPFEFPHPTHANRFIERNLVTVSRDLPLTMGLREALGLDHNGPDGLSPTLRSGLSSPRHTTSILSSVSAQKKFAELGIWPNGVAYSRSQAANFLPKNRHFRLSVDDCALIQGFPSQWKLFPPVYMAIGVLGNAVVPPLAYQLAKKISETIQR